MDYLSIADILEHTLPEGDVEVPEWGGTVRVRAVTSAEFARCQRRATGRNGELNGFKLNALIVIAGCVEPAMNPGLEVGLMKAIPGPLDRISNVILDLSGMGDKEDDDDDPGEA